jgi:transposase InsO family protein
MHKYSNLTVDYVPAAPNHLWVSDITYIEAEGCHGYLSLITDAFSHKIVGWNLSRTLRASGALAALRMALSSLKGKHPELIHHSDRGSQYCCRDYVNQLKGREIQISMTESGDPRENAIAERINGILKTEWIYVCKPDSWQGAVAFMGRIIDLYNNQRPHQSIGYMPPALIHQTGLKTERKWKNYYRNGSVSAREITGGNGDKSSESDRAKDSCPMKERKALHCHVENRKTGKQQSNKIIQEI